jgi:hypothetical protein
MIRISGGELLKRPEPDVRCRATEEEEIKKFLTFHAIRRLTAVLKTACLRFMF